MEEATHQEPVKVHDSEKQQERIEEEVEGNVGHRAQAAVACGIQDLEREPVEAEPEPVVGITGQGSCGQEREGGWWPRPVSVQCHLASSLRPCSSSPILVWLPPTPTPSLFLLCSCLLPLISPSPPGPAPPARSPAEAEAEAAQVCSQGVQRMMGASTGLEIHIELGELQLHVADVMQEEHQNAHVVVPEKGGQAGRGEGGSHRVQIPALRAPGAHLPCLSETPLAHLPCPTPQRARSAAAPRLRSPGDSPTWVLTSLSPGGPGACLEVLSLILPHFCDL